MTVKTRIPIGGYLIKADAVGWIYGRPSTSWSKKDEKDVEGFIRPLYAATLSRALTGLLELVLHESAAQSLAEIRNTIEGFKKEVREALEVHEG